jgi:hypothetical protein
LKGQVRLPLSHKGIQLDRGYKALAIENSVVLDLKSVDQPFPVHSAQRPADRKLSLGKPAGLLINFNLPILGRAFKRRVNHAAAGPGVPSAGSRGEAGDEENARNSSDTLKTRISASAVK